ncbi:MAG: glycosyltransferase family 4 protein [Nitrospina sp.]|nr:glycosyltransferase family 4 protein [Nitrospina sp.]MBT5632634.1 glycosyltransferase family 4 protein [Nitrospina sp.]
MSQPESSHKPKGRLTFLIHKISAGGAQRVLTLLANELCDKGWSVTVLTFDNGREPVFFDLHPRITHWPLSLMRKQESGWKAVKAFFLRPLLLRRAIRKSNPDAVIAFIELMNILTVMATLGLKIPVIVSERGNPFFSPLGRFWSFLRQESYKRATCLVVQTHGARSFFSTSIQKNSCVIPNPVLVPGYLTPSSKSELNSKTVMAIGRLSREKGFDLLLNAFAPLAKKFPDWILEICGEGLERKSLKSLCDELGLKKQVRFSGLTTEHYRALSRADIFVLPSRHEGFPNVLGEAMACGLPVVSFNCSYGPSEMIQDGVNGLLVPPENILELSDSLERLMISAELRKKIGEQAIHITERYSLESISQAWEDLVVNIVHGPKI